MLYHNYITIQHRQIGEEDDFRCVHKCMYMCAFLSCAHACIHHRPYYTISHHPLTHQIYRQWCVCTRQFMECREHHLTEQADLKVLLHLCRSLQDLLKYCWVTLGVRDKGVGLSDAYTHSCACTYTCKQNTILHAPCCLTSCETHCTTTMPIPSCTQVCGEEGGEGT